MYWSAFEDLFEKGNGVTRRVVPARKDENNPVLQGEMPWEGKNVCYPSLLRDPEDGRYRIWYKTEMQFMCYAESDDGSTWVRPELGRIVFEGSKANNIVFNFADGFTSTDGPCVIRDDAAEPDERYKMTFSEAGGDRTGGGIHLLVSPNGLDWRVKQAPIINVRNDSQCCFFRDPVTKRYFCYHRPNFIVRTIAKSVSDDAVHWTGHNHFIPQDVHDKTFGLEPYAIAIFPYDGHLLGFLKMYARPWNDRRCWLELVVCRDDWETGHGSFGRGERWLRLTDRRPIVSLGEPESWDSFRMAPGHGLVPDGDGHWFYYHCGNTLHCKGAVPHSRSAIGRAYVPLRGFFDWYADRDDAWVRTKPLLFEGEDLVLDYDAADGEVRASVLMADGSVPEGFGLEDGSVLTGASHSGKVSFSSGSFARFEDRPAHLLFHLPRRGRLFGFGVL